MFDTPIRDAVRQMVGPWWAFLVAGVAWFVISFVVLQMSLTSVRAVGVLLGVIFRNIGHRRVHGRIRGW